MGNLGTGFGITTAAPPGSGGMPGPPFAANSASNGLSVDPVTKQIVFGNDVGGNAADLLKNRDLNFGSFGANFISNGGDVPDVNAILNFDGVSTKFFRAWLIPGGRFIDIPTSNFANPSIGDFNFTLSATPQGAGEPDNNVLMWGYNQSAGGGIQNGGDSSVHFAIESFYAPGPGVNWKEVHMPQINFLRPGFGAVPVRAISHTIKVAPSNSSINTDNRATKFNWYVLQEPIDNTATVRYTAEFGQSGGFAISGFQPSFQLVDTDPGGGGTGGLRQSVDLDISSTRNINLQSNGNINTSANQALNVNGGITILTNVNFGQCLSINDNTPGGQTGAIFEIQRLANPVFRFFSSTNLLIGSSSDTGQKLMVDGDIRTANPGNGAGAWQLGTVVVGASALDATQYVEVKIGGVVRKLALVL